ncbi:unnamed protein product [Bemisia tabaci]|uniref:Uncharacterized protein n=1 Tax=Bemisia tabaci TaxID=7038 RepID=A0A9N9ZZ52_BEMTA|nr:unnamed protein product [Bemisia tabaci]
MGTLSAGMVLPGSKLTLSIILIINTVFWELVFSAGNPLFQNRKVLSVLHFDNCVGEEYPFKFVKWSFIRNRTTIIINGEEIITRNIDEPLTIFYRIEKCNDKANPDTCEYYNTWRWDNLCTMMKVLPFISTTRNLHTPPLSCPFRKGHYYVRNAKFDTFSLLQFLQTVGNNNRAMWKFRMEIYEKDQIVCCLDFSIQVVNFRTKNSRGNTSSSHTQTIRKADFI